jgi:hypothetical protein
MEQDGMITAKAMLMELEADKAHWINLAKDLNHQAISMRRIGEVAKAVEFRFRRDGYILRAREA